MISMIYEYLFWQVYKYYFLQLCIYYSIEACNIFKWSEKWIISHKSVLVVPKINLILRQPKTPYWLSIVDWKKYVTVKLSDKMRQSFRNHILFVFHFVNYKPYSLLPCLLDAVFACLMLDVHSYLLLSLFSLHL